MRRVNLVNWVKALKTLLSALVLSLPSLVMADVFLLMAEEPGCAWCEKWDKEIGHIYPKTAEGQAAPLRRYDLHSETPDVAFAQRVHFTPTFVLVQNGLEVGRIEGHPGEDFFWGLLARLFRDANIPLDPSG